MFNIPTHETVRQRSLRPKDTIEEPARAELASLAHECFPPIEESKVIITEYSQNVVRSSTYTLEEVLSSECILQPNNPIPHIRWIYVEYYKMGIFWGSDHRFAQWGTDPVIFEKSPIPLLQARMAELDANAGRRPLEEEDIPGYKRIGKYYREYPGCPEWLGIRVNASSWLQTEPYQLLLDYLTSQPKIAQSLQREHQTDLEYGIHFINAIQAIKGAQCEERPGLLDLRTVAAKEDVYTYGSWDDNIERLEFYGEHTLLSCGSPRLYEFVANRLHRKDDVLRQNLDCALLYYTLARVSIENDEMMQDAPERALNKVFTRLKNSRSTNRAHIELVFSLQQTVLDGLEYLEENKRELPIWGIPPWDNHLVNFHPNHSPPPNIQELIQAEMDLISKDFDKIIDHWRLLKSKVDRYLDVLLQFRVLDQQELAVSQNQIAAKNQSLAVEEARTARVQSRSIFVFTAITIIFLPLSFFTSYFGMNFMDILNTAHTSSYFWKIAAPVSGTILVGIFPTSQYLSRDRNVTLDEEEAISGDLKAESEASWRRRLGFRKGKVKLKLR